MSHLSVLYSKLCELFQRSVNSELSSCEILLFFFHVAICSFHSKRLFRYYTILQTYARSLLLSANYKRGNPELSRCPFKIEWLNQVSSVVNKFRARMPRANERPPRKFTISCFEIEINRFVQRCSINGARCFHAVAPISLHSVDRERERGGGKKWIDRDSARSINERTSRRLQCSILQRVRSSQRFCVFLQSQRRVTHTVFITTVDLSKLFYSIGFT